MQPKASIDLRRLGSECLLSIQSLSEELACAITAIAQNNIISLEKHIEVQQALCAQLLSLGKSSHHLRTEPEVWSSIMEELPKLIRRNHVYSKLLAASGRNHRVMLTLCKTYIDSPSHAAEQNPIDRSLSCEV